MKQIIFILVFSVLCSIQGSSQIYGRPMKGAYCFGNIEHNFMSELSQQSKNVFDEIIKNNNIDTSKLYRVKYNEIFTKYGLKSYLSKHTYTYVSWSNYEGKIKMEKSISFNGYNTQKPDKLIILYTTNKSDIEDLSFYIVN